MVEMALLAFFMIFAIVGICEFIYIIRLMICFPCVRMHNYTFILLKKGFALKQLVFLWQKIKWQGDEFAIGIIAVTDELDSKESLECENYIKDKNILLCTYDALNECTRLL